MPFNSKISSKKWLLTALVVLGFVATTWAQSAAETLAAVQQTYANAEGMHLEFQVNLFSRNSGTLLQKQAGSIQQHDQAVRMNYNGTTVIQNRNCHVLVDAAHQCVIYQNPLEKQDKKNAADPNPNALLDQWVSADNPPVWANDASGNLRTIRLNLQDPYYERIEITVDTRKKVIQNFVVFYRDIDEISLERAEITYSKVELNPRLPKSTFSEKSIVKAQGKQLELTDAYRQYKLIDQR
ncbi:MAG: outer membrane lipoprotein carrier protein LolA [Salibacteraceae bacterium]